MMDQALTRSSIFIGLSGAAAVLFGITALVWPSITLVVLIALFGAYALVAGIFTLVAGIHFATERLRHWVAMVLGGAAGIAIGALTFFRPGITALALLYLVAGWAIVTGVFEIVGGIELTGAVKTAWLFWLAGLFSVAFGVLVALRPDTGILTIVWLIGIYSILTGAMRLGVAYRMRTAESEIKSAVRSMEPAPR